MMESQPKRHPVRLFHLQGSSMISARPTKFRFTLWTAVTLLAVIGALWTLPQSALTAPHRPTGLTAIALDHDTVSLTWSHLDEETVDHYKVLRRPSDESKLSQIATTQNTTFQDDGLQTEMKYTYRVKTVDSEGAVSGRSIRSQITTAGAPTITPVNPTPEYMPAQVDTEVWSGTLTVRELRSTILGCSNSVSGNNCSAHLSDDDFTHDSANYVINVVLVRSTGRLAFEFETDLTTDTRGLTLNINGTAFAFDYTDSCG